MAKKWVLDTETKGTGANMVPLEKVLKTAEDQRAPERLQPSPHVPPAPPETPPRPPRFRVVDVMTREVLVDDADGRALVDLLKEIRSVVDVRISRWDYEGERWWPLDLDAQRALWRLRDSY
jgi:hypothetical protein